MDFRRYFNRNAQARDHLELFLVSAISSLLLLRFYLFATGYPEVGGGTLHIAHMLYGGLLMMVSVVISVSFLGVRSERVAAFVGGVGFGVFIDELGKFITKDNNYFFRPTIGIIYALFCVLYLTFNFISRRQRLTSEEYQLNALRQFEEAVLHDMDKNEKQRMHQMLRGADQSSPITKSLVALLKDIDTIEINDGWSQKIRQFVAGTYSRFWKQRSSSKLVTLVFVVQALIFIGFVINAILNNFNNFHDLFETQDNYAHRLIVGQLFASLVAGGFVVVGAIRLPVSRYDALDWFSRAVLTNLFLTEFFIFCRIQFQALPGFLINLMLLGLLRYALTQEHHR